jgi:hypothetical protein
MVLSAEITVLSANITALSADNIMLSADKLSSFSHILFLRQETFPAHPSQA